MKKLYTLIVIIFIYSKTLKAQGYYPMLDSVSNTWYYVSNVIPVNPIQTPLINCFYGSMAFADALIYYTPGDTVMNGFSYKVLMQHDYFSPGNICLHGFMREDTATRKIYFVDNLFSPEELLYDFSMQIGDSININFYQSGGYYMNGVFTLDSISTITIPAGVRNLFYLNNHAQPFAPTMQWIESVGHPGDIIYSKSCNFWGGYFGMGCYDKVDRNFCQLLTCFEHSNFKVYFDSCSHANALNNFCVQYIDSCNYWNVCGGIEEFGIVKSFIVSPNPSTEEITISIETNKKTEADFVIRNIEGREVVISKTNNLLPGKESLKLPVRNLEKGIYFIECRMKEGSMYRKLAVQ